MLNAGVGGFSEYTGEKLVIDFVFLGQTRCSNVQDTLKCEFWEEGLEDVQAKKLVIDFFWGKPGVTLKCNILGAFKNNSLLSEILERNKKFFIFCFLFLLAIKKGSEIRGQRPTTISDNKIMRFNTNYITPKMLPKQVITCSSLRK